MKRLLPLLLVLLVAGIAWWSIGSDPGGGNAPVTPGPDADDPEIPPVAPEEDEGPAAPESGPAPTPPPLQERVPWVPDPNGLPIAGRVVSTGGDAVEGAEVHLWRRAADGWITPPVLRTAKDGSFRIDGLPEGRYQLFAESPLFKAASLRDVPAGRTDVLFSLSAAGQIHVILHAPDGAELPEQIRVQHHAELWRPAQDRFQRVTEDCAQSRAFDMDGLPAGRYRVGARALGVGTGTRDDVVVEVGRTTEIDLHLSVGAVIEGRILSEATGKPIPGALVVAGPAGRGLSPLYLMDEDMAFWNEGAPARTDDEGKFRIPGLTAGKYDLAARAPGHRPVLERGVSAPTGESPLVLRLAEGGSVEVFVLDREGKPVADVSVDADIEDGSFDAETDAEGRCVIDGLPPGPVVVGAYTNLWSRSVTVKVLAGRTVKVTVQAPLGEAVLSGVLTLGGRPLADRQVSVEFEDGGEVFVSALSGPDGKYRLVGLPVRSIEIVLRDSRGQPRPLGSLDLRPGENTFDHDLPDGSLLLRIVDEVTREPVAGAAVYAGLQWLVNAGADGLARIPELAETPLDLLVTSSRHAPRAVRARPAVKPTEVLVALRASVALTVTVADPDGQPIPFPEIEILDSEGRDHSAAALRWDGKVEAKGITRFALAPGRYRLTVSAESHQPKEQEVEVPDAGAAVRVVLEKE